VLIELGVVEQRHQAILEVLGGLSVTEVARRYGVTRQTVHRWLRRYHVPSPTPSTANRKAPADNSLRSVVGRVAKARTFVHAVPQQAGFQFRAARRLPMDE